MESIAGTQASISVEAAVSAIKDNTGAQLISQTLDRLNTSTPPPGAMVNADYQFQKDVLNAAGIGTKLDAIV